MGLFLIHFRRRKLICDENGSTVYAKNKLREYALAYKDSALECCKAAQRRLIALDDLYSEKLYDGSHQYAIAIHIRRLEELRYIKHFYKKVQDILNHYASNPSYRPDPERSDFSFLSDLEGLNDTILWYQAEFKSIMRRCQLPPPDGCTRLFFFAQRRRYHIDALAMLSRL